MMREVCLDKALILPLVDRIGEVRTRQRRTAETSGEGKENENEQEQEDKETKLREERPTHQGKIDRFL